jgi:hypothetical protein
MEAAAVASMRRHLPAPPLTRPPPSAPPLAPKEYLPEAALAPLTRPDRLRPGLFKWIPQLFAADGEAVMAAAGVDAWTFVRVCHLAIQLFTVITLWCGATCLVVNLLGKEVATSLATGGKEVTTSYGYTYWEPTPDAPKDGKKAKKEKPVDTPDFFVPEEDLPRRPPGLDWKQYRTDVPPLDEALAVAYLKNATANKVKSYTDEEIARFIFMRDQTSMADDRSLADIDKATIANVADRSPTLWVHALTAWVVTATTLGLLAKVRKQRESGVGGWAEAARRAPNRRTRRPPSLPLLSPLSTRARPSRCACATSPKPRKARRRTPCSSRTCRAWPTARSRTRSTERF